MDFYKHLKCTINNINIEHILWTILIDNSLNSVLRMIPMLRYKHRRYDSTVFPRRTV